MKVQFSTINNYNKVGVRQDSNRQNRANSCSFGQKLITPDELENMLKGKPLNDKIAELAELMEKFVKESKDNIIGGGVIEQGTKNPPKTGA